MGKPKIELTVTIIARYVGDEVMPASTIVEETVSLIIPRMDDKFVVFPKVLEGATLSVIEEHSKRVQDWEAEQDKQKRQAQERAKMLPFPERNGSYN
jgi:hypothetical protein